MTPSTVRYDAGLSKRDFGNATRSIDAIGCRRHCGYGRNAGLGQNSITGGPDTIAVASIRSYRQAAGKISLASSAVNVDSGIVVSMNDDLSITAVDGQNAPRINVEATRSTAASIACFDDVLIAVQRCLTRVRYDQPQPPACIDRQISGSDECSTYILYARTPPEITGHGDVDITIELHLAAQVGKHAIDAIVRIAAVRTASHSNGDGRSGRGCEDTITGREKPGSTSI